MVGNLEALDDTDVDLNRRVIFFVDGRFLHYSFGQKIFEKYIELSYVNIFQNSSVVFLPRLFSPPISRWFWMKTRTHFIDVVPRHEWEDYIVFLQSLEKSVL